jgi:ferredoxin/flavodoxin
MKALVIYYSVAGSTRKVAQAIHKGMSGLVDSCDIVALRGAQGVPGMHMGHLLEYDLIGIGSPCWRGMITPNILEFIRRMPSQDIQSTYARDHYKLLKPAERQHYFFFVTHGKGSMSSMRQAWDALTARSLTVIGWNDWYGNGYMAYAAVPWWTYGHPDEAELQEAEAFGRQMVERSRKIAGGATSLIPKMPEGREYEELYGRTLPPSFFSDPGSPANTGRFKVKHFYGVKIIEEKCTRCGLCAENCPMDAIDLDAKDPILPSCIWCTTCELVCPTGAIDINMAGLKKDRGATPEELRAHAEEMQERFVKDQNEIKPEKRMQFHLDPKDLWTRGYVADIPKHPHVVIPVQGWDQISKK